MSTEKRAVSKSVTAYLVGTGAALSLCATGMVREDSVIARYEGGRITVRELEAAIANKDVVSRARLATPEGLRRLLTDIENYDLLVAEAERRGYAKHPAVVDAARSAAVDAMLASEIGVEPASIPVAEVAREYETQRARVSPPMKKAPSFSKAEGLLRAELARRRFERAREELVRRLFDEHSPEIHVELVDAIAPELPGAPDRPRGFSAAPADPRAPTRLVD